MELKTFLYLDTDYLNSYMSQINKGQKIFEIFNKLSSTYAGEKSIPDSEEKSFEADAGASLYTLLNGNIKAGRKYIDGGIEHFFTETESGQQMVAKLVHDNAFFDLCKYLNRNFSVLGR